MPAGKQTRKPEKVRQNHVDVFQLPSDPRMTGYVCVDGHPQHAHLQLKVCIRREKRAFLLHTCVEVSQRQRPKYVMVVRKKHRLRTYHKYWRGLAGLEGKQIERKTALSGTLYQSGSIEVFAKIIGATPKSMFVLVSHKCVWVHLL